MVLNRLSTLGGVVKHTYVVFGRTQLGDNPQLRFEHALIERELRSCAARWNGKLVDFAAQPGRVVARFEFFIGVDAVERILQPLLGEFIDAWTVLGTTRAVHHGWTAAEYPDVLDLTQRLMGSA